MNQQTWDSLSPEERDAKRDLSGLSPQLSGLEGYRVEVEDKFGEVRRFYVSRSTGWKPCHIEIKTRRSMGGGAADSQYKTVRKLYKR